MAFRQNGDCRLGAHHRTEGLGFESFFETGPSSSGEFRGVPEVDSAVTRRERVYLEMWAKRKTIARERVRRELPPPLPWLSMQGHPSVVLHPERRDGRIIMTAVRLDHHDVFLADCHGGRLTLQLVGGAPQPFTATTTNNNDDDESDDPNEESKELDEQEDEDPGSPGKPVQAIDLDGPIEKNVANCDGAKKKQEIQAERYESLAKSLNAAITIASKIEVHEYKKHGGGGLMNEYYGKEREKEDHSESCVDQLLPAMMAGSSQGLWRCCDREEIDGFWNHRYVTTA